MNKELIFVYDWVGPLGPLNNFKVPDIYDLMKKLPHTGWINTSATNEQEPLSIDLQKYAQCRFVPSYDFKSLGNKPFF